MAFREAFFHFENFFRKKTGIDWDNRLEGIKMSDEYFVYTPPILGRPVGYVYPGYQRPELRVREMTEGESGESALESESAEEGEGDGVVYDTDSEAEYDDSEEDSRSATVISGTESLRARPEEDSEKSLRLPSGSRVESEDEEIDRTFTSGFRRSFSATFGDSFGGSFSSEFVGSGSTATSEGLGRSQQDTAQATDRLEDALEEAVNARTPPGLIYISD